MINKDGHDIVEPDPVKLQDLKYSKESHLKTLKKYFSKKNQTNIVGDVRNNNHFNNIEMSEKL
jgi:hypothetical protein